MVKRSTWVMVILLAILAGLAYYLQQPENLIKKALASRETPTAEPPGQLISPADGPLNGVSIQKTGGQSITLERKNSGWTLIVGSENPAPADQSVAEQAASQAQSLRLAGKITSTTPDLSAFGLDKPVYIFKLILADGKSVSFKIGNATLAGDGYYAQKEDGTVVILEKYGLDPLLNLLQQPPYMFTPTPQATGTPSPTPTLSITSTAGPTPIIDLTPTKQP
jgi:hypothetical protein